nr:hypothetical protein L203_02986 [Cryptococcus depauperatus CBS 7841]
MVSPPPQPVPTRNTRSSNPHPAPLLPKTGASPMSYGAMTGISFTNGGGFSFEGKPRSVKWGNGGIVGSFGARFYGDAGNDSPVMIPFSTSITMEPSSFAASAQHFNLPMGSMSSSYHRRSYAAAVSGRDPNNISTSFASMSFQPMSLSTSYNRSQVQGMMARTDAELTKAYECCGKTHSGLHALLEHVEDCHPFSDPQMPPDTGDGFSPVTHAMDLDLEEVEEEPSQAPTSGSSRSSLSPATSTAVPVPSYPLPTKGPLPTVTTNTGAGSVDKSPLKLSDVLKSPPEASPQIRASNLTLTRTQSSSSSPPDNSLATPTTSAQPSPVFPQPKINPSRPSGFLGANNMGLRPAAQQKRFDRAFNEVVAGKKDAKSKNDMPTAVAPGVLFASAVSNLGIPTVPPGSRPSPPAAKELNPDAAEGAAVSTPAKSAITTLTQTPSQQNGQLAPTTPGQNQLKQTTGPKLFSDPPMTQPSLFSSHKPWRCPNPGCNKAYKQSNGLKYHQQKGQCDFAVHDAVDLGLTLEEAEERNRPFVCAVGAGCTKRYRQMNGLKYHYLNSGDHGLYGLRMLQNGTHPHPPSLPSPTAARITTRPTGTAAPASSINSPRPAGAPYAIPSRDWDNTNHSIQGRVVGQQSHAPHHGHQMPRMGTFPTRPGGNGGAGVEGMSMQRPAGQNLHSMRYHQSSMQPKPQPQPVQKGRDAVLFAAIGEDPMDIMGRMDT